MNKAASSALIEKIDELSAEATKVEALITKEHEKLVKAAGVEMPKKKPVEVKKPFEEVKKSEAEVFKPKRECKAGECYRNAAFVAMEDRKSVV